MKRSPTPNGSRKRAEIYREAAEHALNNGAWAFLKGKGIEPLEAGDWLLDTVEERCISLCFIATWIEAGDA